VRLSSCQQQQPPPPSEARTGKICTSSLRDAGRLLYSQHRMFHDEVRLNTHTP